MLRDRLFFGRRTNTFTLQWHLTNACENKCSHCYDRSDIAIQDLFSSIRIVKKFQGFCKKRNIKGHISLTGGNPFLYPHFMELYKEISNAGFTISIYANPVPEELIKNIINIQKPQYFQLSLEGLKDHNDLVRGKGGFEKTFDFLEILKKHEIRRHIMLTLTLDNIQEVMALGEKLKKSVDRFTFNRLSQVGEGVNLSLPSKIDYYIFMKKYLIASRSNRVLGFKDNLFNIFNYHFGRHLFGGCTHFGCGAAFNFVACLPNGEIHACRKFPSKIGNINENDFNAIYNSIAAKKYRRGPNECYFCPIRNKCGGCQAVSYSHGLNIFEKKDPHCFMKERKKLMKLF